MLPTLLRLGAGSRAAEGVLGHLAALFRVAVIPRLVHRAAWPWGSLKIGSRPLLSPSPLPPPPAPLLLPLSPPPSPSSIYYFLVYTQF